MLTKRLVQEALIEMLQEKSIGEIYIRDLCLKAGINRTTFYNHYGSQHDVMKELTDTFLENINDFLSRKVDAENNSSAQKLTSVFRYMEDHILLSRTMLNNITDPDFSRKLLSLPSIQKFLDNFPEDMNPNLKELASSYILNGSYCLMKEWINSEDRIPIKEEVEIILLLIRSTYQGLL